MNDIDTTVGLSITESPLACKIDKHRFRLKTCHSQRLHNEIPEADLNLKATGVQRSSMVDLVATDGVLNALCIES